MAAEQQDAFAEAAAARGHALVVVAGDVGRSPRMQYHALSLAEEGRAVTLVGYAGERCIDALVRHACVREVRIAEPSRRFGFLGRVYRLLALCFALGRALFKARRDYRASLVLCQTPPALPAAVCILPQTYTEQLGRSRLRTPRLTLIP